MFAEIGIIYHVFLYLRPFYCLSERRCSWVLLPNASLDTSFSSHRLFLSRSIFCKFSQSPNGQNQICILLFSCGLWFLVVSSFTLLNPRFFLPCCQNTHTQSSLTSINYGIECLYYVIALYIYISILPIQRKEKNLSQPIIETHCVWPRLVSNSLHWKKNLA